MGADGGLENGGGEVRAGAMGGTAAGAVVFIVMLSHRWRGFDGGFVGLRVSSSGRFVEGEIRNFLRR